MKSAPLHPDESNRIALLQALQVLDTPEDTSFDALTGLASEITDMPIALVSLVDKDRQWFKSHHGLDARETSRDVAFCAHAILDPDEMLSIVDSRQDERFIDNPLVVNAPNVICYHGIPLCVGPDRLPVGTFCVIDHKPHKLEQQHVQQLRLLARQVELLLEGCLREAQLQSRLDEINDREQRLSVIFETMGEGLAVQDKTGGIISCNNAAEEILGLSKDQLAGKSSIDSLWRSLHEDGSDFPGTEHPAMCVLRDGQPRNKVIMAIDSGDRKRHWISINSRPLFAEDGKTVKAAVTTFSDITDLKIQQEELREAKIRAELLREQAQAASRAKSQFLSSMSHELRTPLNAIIGFSKRLLNSTNENFDERSVTALESIHRNGKHLLGLINDLLDISKIESGHDQLRIDKIDAAALTREVACSLEPLLTEKGLSLVLDFSDQYQIQADPDKLRQVLVNLYGNAIRYSKQGVITFHCSEKDLRGTAGIQIEVQDEGIGISETDQKYLFERFYQSEKAARQGEGYGIGLALVKGIVDLHGGHVEVKSAVNKGSRFSVWLPKYQKPE